MSNSLSTVLKLFGVSSKKALIQKVYGENSSLNLDKNTNSVSAEESSVASSILDIILDGPPLPDDKNNALQVINALFTNGLRFAKILYDNKNLKYNNEATLMEALINPDGLSQKYIKEFTSHYIAKLRNNDSMDFVSIYNDILKDRDPVKDVKQVIQTLIDNPDLNTGNALNDILGGMQLALNGLDITSKNILIALTANKAITDMHMRVGQDQLSGLLANAFDISNFYSTHKKLNLDDDKSNLSVDELKVGYEILNIMTKDSLAPDVSSSTFLKYAKLAKTLQNIGYTNIDYDSLEKANYIDNVYAKNSKLNLDNNVKNLSDDELKYGLISMNVMSNIDNTKQKENQIKQDDGSIKNKYFDSDFIQAISYLKSKPDIPKTNFKQVTQKDIQTFLNIIETKILGNFKDAGGNALHSLPVIPPDAPQQPIAPNGKVSSFTTIVQGLSMDGTMANDSDTKIANRNDNINLLINNAVDMINRYSNTGNVLPTKCVRDEATQDLVFYDQNGNFLTDDKILNPSKTNTSHETICNEVNKFLSDKLDNIDLENISDSIQTALNKKDYKTANKLTSTLLSSFNNILDKYTDAAGNSLSRAIQIPPASPTSPNSPEGPDSPVQSFIEGKVTFDQVLLETIFIVEKYYNSGNKEPNSFKATSSSSTSESYYIDDKGNTDVSDDTIVKETNTVNKVDYVEDGTSKYKINASQDVVNSVYSILTSELSKYGLTLGDFAYFEPNSIEYTLSTNKNIKKELGDGNNSIVNYEQYDTLTAGNGKNTITDYGAYHNITVGSGSNYIYHVGQSSNITVKGDGDNTITSYGAENTVKTGNGDNSIFQQGQDSTVTTGSGDDTITSYGANCIINARAGDNSISQEGQNTSIKTYKGDDAISSNGAYNTINAGDGNNSISQQGQYSTVVTGSGNDTITSYGAYNNINAGDGNNSVYQEGQCAGIKTGSGNNDIKVEGALSKITLGNGDNKVFSLGQSNTVTTGSGNDVLDVQGAQTVINSGAGNDKINILGNDVCVNSGSGNDTVTAAGENIKVELGDGSDYFYGINGSDTVYGGAGNDTYVFNENSGNDIISDSAGTDLVKFGSGVLKKTVAFFKQGVDLIVGYSDGNLMTVQKQSNSGNAVEKFQLSDGKFLTDNDINVVIQQMTTYASKNGICLTSVDNVLSNKDLMNIVSNAWHS